MDSDEYDEFAPLRRLPDEVRHMLTGIADQIEKRQHFNSVARIAQLQAWCMKDLRAVLNEAARTDAGSKQP